MNEESEKSAAREDSPVSIRPQSDPALAPSPSQPHPHTGTPAGVWPKTKGQGREIIKLAALTVLLGGSLWLLNQMPDRKET